MSLWYTAKDVDIDPISNSVDILIDSNDKGNTYVTVTYEQIKAVYEILEGANEHTAKPI